MGVDFDVQRLNAEQVSRYLAAPRSVPLIQASETRPDASVSVRSGYFSQRVFGEDVTTFFNVSQRNRLYQAPDGTTAVQYLYAFSLSTVDQRSREERDLQTSIRNPISQEGAFYYLPAGLSVSAAYYGDVDNDGIQDILLRFSNGTGFFYRGRPAEPASWGG